ncbi:unnamed protein product [Rotaria sordida]|uniref:Uncharacterized protein n=1 Tax=Rotaria sordida TaxID=392033 RepID=A0A814WES7_9BILA|nr:unnamed protein product [Rotaria sordida]
MSNMPWTNNKSLDDNQRYLTAAVWTVHFGYDNNARPSLDRVASVLADTSAFALSIFIGSILPLLFYKIARALSAHIVFIANFPYIIQFIYAVWTSA